MDLMHASPATSDGLPDVAAIDLPNDVTFGDVAHHLLPKGSFAWHASMIATTR